MQHPTRQYLTTGFVLLGALVLFGPVAGVAVLVAVRRLAEVLGATLAAGSPFTLVAFALAAIAVAVGWVAVRTAMAFHRGWQDRPIDPLA